MYHLTRDFAEHYTYCGLQTNLIRLYDVSSRVRSQGELCEDCRKAATGGSNGNQLVESDRDHEHHSSD